MNSALLSTLHAHYNWQLSLVTLVSIFALTAVSGWIVQLVPTIRAASRRNAQVFAEKMAKPNYAANQRWNRKWSGAFLAIIFLGIIPFCVTWQMQPLWRALRDMVVILMFYDFIYYLTHRFLFHNGGWFDGPLMWMHAVHHRQHNPCRWDSSYIHPLEVAMGLGLYVFTIALFAWVWGPFNFLTIVVTWFAFTTVNLHNHNLWESDRFPFRYLNFLSVMHHNHHARFTGGNYATISLLYDWMFGTLDYGDAPRKAIGRKAA